MPDYNVNFAAAAPNNGPLSGFCARPETWKDCIWKLGLVVSVLGGTGFVIVYTLTTPHACDLAGKAFDAYVDGEKAAANLPALQCPSGALMQYYLDAHFRLQSELDSCTTQAANCVGPKVLSFGIGDTVQGNWNDEGKWFGARVAQVHSDETFTVIWDDNDQTGTTLSAHAIRAPICEEMEKANILLRKEVDTYKEVFSKVGQKIIQSAAGGSCAEVSSGKPRPDLPSHDLCCGDQGTACSDESPINAWSPDVSATDPASALSTIFTMVVVALTTL